jgi:ABC-type sugar transport system ATPase subunit
VAEVVFDEVSKAFPGPVLAVEELSLEVGNGEFLILVGPSGCGKSTTLRMVAGLERISAGTIRIGDRVINDVPPKDRDIAMVFQNYALYPHMTVEKNLAFGLRQRRTQKPEVRRRVDDVARLLGLADLLKRRPGQLSGGQRQRVAMGRALVREPAVFLLDEPLSNLDAQLRLQMRAELKTLHTRIGVTTIYVTHDQTEAMTLGDRVAVMLDGKLQQCGRPQEVYDHPANAFVAGFIGSPPMNFLAATVSGGRLRAGDLEVEHVRTGDGEVVVGIRPEAIRPVGEADAGPGFEIVVDVVEPLGDVVIVHGTVQARNAAFAVRDAMLLPDERGDRAVVALKMEAHLRPEAGTRIHAAVSREGMHLFDPETGERLAA